MAFTQTLTSGSDALVVGSKRELHDLPAQFPPPPLDCAGLPRAGSLPPGGFSSLTMYADPSFIREHVVKIRLNENEADLIDAWVKYTGQQKAVLLREMLLKQAQLDMGLEFMGTSCQQEGAWISPERALNRA